MPNAHVNGTRIHYEVDGTGPPCFVLHGGLGFDHVAYRRTLTPLADDLRLVFLDHRGNGRSDRPPLDTITMEQLADDVVGLADHLDIDRFLVLGHSYGGFIAQELTLRHPDRVAGLVLVATTPGQPGEGEDVDRYAGPPLPDEMVAALATVPKDDGEFGARVPDLLRFYLHHRDPAEVVPLLDGTVFSLDAMLRGFEVLSTWSSVDRLSSIACPVLFVVGQHDLFTTARQGERVLHHLGHGTLVVFDECGHYPWLEHPDAFFTAVRDWLPQVVLP